MRICWLKWWTYTAFQKKRHVDLQLYECTKVNQTLLSALPLGSDKSHRLYISVWLERCFVNSSRQNQHLSEQKILWNDIRCVWIGLWMNTFSWYLWCSIVKSRKQGYHFQRFVFIMVRLVQVKQSRWLSSQMSFFGVVEIRTCERCFFWFVIVWAFWSLLYFSEWYSLRFFWLADTGFPDFQFLCGHLWSLLEFLPPLFL